MPSGADANKSATLGPLCPGDPIDGLKSYRVMLDDIASGLETADSFAIKFSLLTKTPISKMKHVVHRLPAPIWSGRGRSRAEHILALIGEAGGKGSIVEIENASPASAEAPAQQPAKGQLTCHWCGFPLKEEETHCGFCMTPVGNAERNEHPHEGPKRKAIPSPKRLFCYVVALAVGIVIIEILMR
jgi:hypothetical protein